MRARSSRSRRSTSRPSALVSSSGLHTSSRKSEASSLARVRASRLSVLALARRPIGACGCWHHHASDVRLDHPRDIRRADRRTRAPGPPHPGSARTAQAPAVSSRPSPPSATSPPSAIAPRSGRGGCLPPVKRTCPPLVGDRSKGAADEATRPDTCSQHTRGGGHEQRRPRSHRFEISLPYLLLVQLLSRDSILPEQPERTFLPGRRLGVRARRSASSIGVGDRPPPRCYRHRVARFIESRFAKLKERCVWRHAFETLNEDREVIAAYIDRYDDQPHSGPGYRTPEEVQRTWTVPRSPLQ